MSNVRIERGILTALVEYDLFPYIIKKEITSITPDGLVCCDGYCSRPLIILPADDAIELYNKIVEIRYQHDTAAEKLKKEAMAQIAALAPNVTSKIKIYNKILEDK